MLWAIVVLGIAAEMPMLMFPALVACWPMAWAFIVPTLGSRHGPAETELVLAAVAIGVNSILWGYGISWIMSLIASIRRRSGPESVRRGFEVILPPDEESPGQLPVHDESRLG